MSSEPGAQPVSPRIVSLVPCITHTLLSVGGSRHIVGRTRYCPDCAAEVVGGILDIDDEAIARLDPTLVLADPEENGTTALFRLADRFPVLSVDCTGVYDSLENLVKLARLVGRKDEGTALADAFAPWRQPRSAAATAAVLVWKDPYRCVGSQTYAGSLLRHFGVRLTCTGPGYPGTTLEALAKQKPDLLLLPSEPCEFSPADAEALSAALGSGTRVLIVDGRALFWYGAFMVQSAADLTKALGIPA
jgi:ABC-type hemin transport system substrate-binding protein